MKRTLSTPRTLLALLTAVVLAYALAVPAIASTSRHGILSVTKECSNYAGGAGDHCTVTSSNLNAIPVGATVVYTSAADFVALELHSDLVINARGANAIYGHVDLDLVTGIGTVILSGGTGQFEKFSGTVAVAPLGGADFGWYGTYSY